MSTTDTTSPVPASGSHRWGFIRTVKALWRWQDWKRTGFMDEVTAHGVRFYLDTGCVCLHYMKPFNDAYEPGLLAWMIVRPLAMRVRRKLRANAQRCEAKPSQP